MYTFIIAYIMANFLLIDRKLDKAISVIPTSRINAIKSDKKVVLKHEIPKLSQNAISGIIE